MVPSRMALEEIEAYLRNGRTTSTSTETRRSVSLPPSTAERRQQRMRRGAVRQRY